MKVVPNQPLTDVILTWWCDGCDSLIENGDGYIEVSYTEVHEAEAKWTEGKRAHSDEHGGEVWNMLDLMQMPQAVPWHAWHDKCDPDSGSNTYWIAIERVRNLAQLLDLHGHMGEKNWTKYTDFNDIRRQLPNLYGTC